MVPSDIRESLLHAGAHRASGVAIRTRQTFLLRAHKEMPSWDLRIPAICGAADVTDDYYDFEDPDERVYDEVVAAKQRAIIAGRVVIITGQGSMLPKEDSVLAKEETKDETTPKGKKEAKEEIYYQGSW
ncbi:hypothetical protein B0T24DRAFT_600251 [Lasiosphaeria ovina]|uniref:Uncharacterized protein n=1 Tax=Lasiosphaeria ovina TaxID=92902 RepID=A0AAE0JSW6_9PEZI|nr:hypothetical protein B0T24DRAFT_600251 [Lasiosphaeria ovina]